MKVLCYSVRLERLTPISDKCYKATAFDGTTDLIPSSQVFGMDSEVSKSNAYWISAWILERKSIQYSSKKQSWFDKKSGRKLPNISIEHHTPERKQPITIYPDATLVR